jgi:hypothetical protein
MGSTSSFLDYVTQHLQKILDAEKNVIYHFHD